MADLYGVAIADALRGRPVRLPDPFNPDHLLWRAGEHGLHGLLHEAVEGRKDLPDALRGLEPRLKALAMAQEAVVRIRLHTAREVAAGMARAGVPCVFVKGVALAVEGYETPGLRPFSDLDLLIRPDSVERAASAIEALGFRRDRTVPPSSMEVRYFVDAPPRPPVGVDLHWAFVESRGPQAAVRIPVEEILARAGRCEELPVPSVEDTLLLLAANLIRSRVDRVILLADFQRLVRRRPDWDSVIRRAGEWRLRTALWAGLDHAQRLLGAAVPAGVLARLKPGLWKSASIRRLLSGRILWRRRKFKEQVWSGLFPFVCADSWTDAIQAMRAVRSRD